MARKIVRFRYPAIRLALQPPHLLPGRVNTDKLPHPAGADNPMFAYERPIDI